jgi:hypothetical protein
MSTKKKSQAREYEIITKGVELRSIRNGIGIQVRQLSLQPHLMADTPDAFMRQQLAAPIYLYVEGEDKGHDLFDVMREVADLRTEKCVRDARTERLELQITNLRERLEEYEKISRVYRMSLWCFIKTKMFRRYCGHQFH